MPTSTMARTSLIARRRKSGKLRLVSMPTIVLGRRVQRPTLSGQMLSALSNWEIDDDGKEVLPGKPADHEILRGTKKNPAPHCCSKAYSSAFLRNCPKSTRVVEYIHLSELIYPEYKYEYSRTNLYLAGEVAHQFNCAIFSKHMPQGCEDFRVPWKYAIGFLTIFDVDGDWRKEYMRRLGFDVPTRRAWLVFWKWMEQFGEQESMERYIKLALLSLAQVQYQKRDLNNRPSNYRARLLVNFYTDHNFVYLYEAVFPWKNISFILRKGEPGPASVWPIVQRRKIPFNEVHGFQDVLVNELQPEGLNRANRQSLRTKC
ncbi:hypothetical protein CDD81_4044 [Ophiocordyceps australis]|uniref:Uncharacterized protein n=1 Tax=Ophiocordyceps australis TaxID=1399860 RepID=A0A2C5YC01_9HYPO|nr:hypothetical protein CDD81_4044 [Ophiocordyceps australis]